MMPHKVFRLPKDIPLDEYPKPEEYLEEARLLTDAAQKQGIILRVMGPIALHFHFPEYVDLYHWTMGRKRKSMTGTGGVQALWQKTDK